ncbi:MAG: hypothetical protein A6F71_10775 [Cycloclasticus sp. symbiont of Poecilosclerida sp. M]|nr:MAG: hypothetical protein A6F71_10775 [Cycloclasticus sp. symbiont of Poecilosclerida sp. M]
MATIHGLWLHPQMWLQMWLQKGLGLGGADSMIHARCIGVIQRVSPAAGKARAAIQNVATNPTCSKPVPTAQGAGAPLLKGATGNGGHPRCVGATSGVVPAVYRARA